MITLIIVDCQNDFISGSFAHTSAKNSIKAIKEYIINNSKNISKIVFTTDWHPYNHSSFKKNGGSYPTHCVQFTPGACIEPKLLKLVQSLNIDYSVSTKGELEEVDDLGAFDEIDFRSDYLGDRYYLDIVSVDADTEFVICGSNIKKTVNYTIENLINNDINPMVFQQGVFPSNNINSIINNNKLKVV